MRRPRGRRAWTVGGKEEGGPSGPGAGRGGRGAGPRNSGVRGEAGSAWKGLEGTSSLGQGQNSLGRGVGRTDKRSCAFCSVNSTSKASERNCELRKSSLCGAGGSAARGVRGIPRGEAVCGPRPSRGRRGAVPPPARAEAAGAGPPPGSSGATLELRPPAPPCAQRPGGGWGATSPFDFPRPVERGGGGGERGRRPIGWAGGGHVTVAGRGPGVLTGR